MIALRRLTVHRSSPSSCAGSLRRKRGRRARQQRGTSRDEERDDEDRGWRTPAHRIYRARQTPRTKNTGVKLELGLLLNQGTRCSMVMDAQFITDLEIIHDMSHKITHTIMTPFIYPEINWLTNYNTNLRNIVSHRYKRRHNLQKWKHNDPLFHQLTKAKQKHPLLWAQHTDLAWKASRCHELYLQAITTSWLHAGSLAQSRRRRLASSSTPSS